MRTPSGRSYRWADDEPNSESIPGGLRHSSTMPGGFESMDVTLPRKSGVDYSDLERLSTLRILGASGEVDGEYRLERAPRVSGAQMAITPSAAGWQAHLEDNKSAREIIVDRNLAGSWQGPSVQHQLNGLSTGERRDGGASAPDADTGEPAFKTSVTGAWDAAALPASQGWYDAKGLAIGSLYYAWKIGSPINPANTSWSWDANLTASDIGGAADTSGNLRAAGPAAGTLAATALRKFALIKLAYAAAGGVAGLEYPLFWTCLAVYGDHGLPKRGAADFTNAQGFYGSDVIAHIVQKWAPLLVIDDSIQASLFVIEHLVFTEPTTAAEMIRQTTRFGLQDWAVWEDRTFWWHERGVCGRRWRARISPAQLEETGPQVDRLWESVIVQYQDVDGSTRTVGPSGSGADTISDTLKDPDPDNPANQLGIIRRDLLVMGVGTARSATEVGRRFLEEQKLLDSSGRAQLVGYVEDDHGVLHPYSRVRAGDQISFPDASDTSYRRIVRADHSRTSRTCSIDIDAPPEGLAALLERLGVVLVPLGL